MIRDTDLYGYFNGSMLCYS